MALLGLQPEKCSVREQKGKREFPREKRATESHERPGHERGDGNTAPQVRNLTLWVVNVAVLEGRRRDGQLTK